MNPHAYTGLFRTIDLRYPSNVFAVAAAGAGLGMGLLFGSGIGLALAMAGWAFATWALARELDPDHAVGATAATLVVLGLFIVPEVRAQAVSAFMVTGLLMVSARTAINSTGQSLKPADYALLLGAPFGAALLAQQGGLAALALSTVLALASRHLPLPTYRLLAVVGLVGVLAYVAFGADRGLGVGALLATALGLLQFVRPAPRSEADNGTLLSSERWTAMHSTVLAGALSAAAYLAWPAYVSVLLAWVAALLLTFKSR